MTDEKQQRLGLTTLKKLAKENQRETIGSRPALGAQHDDDGDVLLTVKDVARICRVHEKTVRSWIEPRGEQKVIRKGRLIRITRRALARFLKKK